MLAKPLLIRPNVTLKGFHAGPADAHILANCDANRDAKTPLPLTPVPGGLLIKQDKHPAITLAHNSGIVGLTFSYPEQVPYSGEKVRVIRRCCRCAGLGTTCKCLACPERMVSKRTGRSRAGRSLSAISALSTRYHILDMSGDNPVLRQVAQITVDGLWGYPLSVGVSIQNSLDTIVLRNIQFRPSFFGGACEQITKSSIGFALGKSDGCAMSDVLVFGLGIGILHKCAEGSMGAFSVRVTNANIEAMIPIWFDSRAVDDQVQVQQLLPVPHFFRGEAQGRGCLYSRGAPDVSRSDVRSQGLLRGANQQYQRDADLSVLCEIRGMRFPRHQRGTRLQG